MKKIFTLILLIGAVAFSFSCQKKNNEKQCNCQEPAVIINNITESSADVNLDVNGLDSVKYMYVPKSDGTPTPEMTEKDGIKLEESSFTLTGLKDETEYVFAVYGKCAHGTVFFVTKDFVTLKDDSIVMADGFMAYDGLDSASGMYRLNIMMSSKSMSDSSIDEYDDVVLYVYLKNELERIDDRTRKVPFGKITPFYTDGSELGDMVYYIGKHFTDQDGSENAQGTAVFHNKDGKIASTTVADDTDKSSFEIVDNGDGSYTVKGIYVDKTLGKTYKFKYTDDKAVFSLDQTGM